MTARAALLLFAVLLSPAALAARPVGAGAVRSALRAYAKELGFRPDSFTIKGARTNAFGMLSAEVVVGRETVPVTVSKTDGRLFSAFPAPLIRGLLAAHRALARAGLGARSSFAVALVSFTPGAGGGYRSAQAPLGRPRSGQSTSAVALDSLSLGDHGSAVVRLGQAVVARVPGAAIKVWENGFGPKGAARGTIVDQTPVLVEVQVRDRWHRLGYAGYVVGGDRLLLASALDPIPSGARITDVRVTDDPSAPHLNDSTDGAAAAARGVRGADIVSVQGIPRGPPLSLAGR